MIIAIEGTDGCGKKTQTELLCKYLESKNYKVKKISFPNYDSETSSLVKMYLRGEFGENVNDINAYQASVFYAVDRLGTMLNVNVKDYDFVVFDRYVQSNIIHQSTRIKDLVELNSYIEWLEDLEFDKLKLPKADKILFLDVPIEISMRLAKERAELKNGQDKDIQENDEIHLINAYNRGKYVAEKLNWEIVACSKNGNIKTIDEIHQDILTKLDLKWYNNPRKNRKGKIMEFKFTSKELRKAWLDFYKERGHVDCGAVSLIGDGTTGVMFNVAGMQPLMPYLLGKSHPKGTRLCNVQGCVRTVDIEEVGDKSHCTFFEMLGSWSLGDYFKKERTKWSYELLTQVLKFAPERIAVTCFAGNEFVPKDEETAKYREESGIKKENIYFLPKKDNWWELERGPCGPDSEMFYITDKPCCGPKCNPSCDCGRFVEVGNDVFMQYERISDNEYIPLKQKNVDTGWGLERLLVFLNNTGDVYLTDLFIQTIEHMENVLNVKYGTHEKTTRAMRIIADHIRTAVMLIGDEKGILPSNIGAGYILRRLIRRAVRFAKEIELPLEELSNIAKIYIENIYNETYPRLVEKEEFILTELNREIEKFNKALALGIKEFEKVVSGLERKNQFMKQSNPDYVDEKVINGKAAFRLFDTFGFPIEMTIEMAEENGYSVDKPGFDESFRQHQELARTASAGAFKGGLADDSVWTTRLHTANHILLAGLRKMFGNHVEQKGSNITSERLRFDFNFERKLTDEEVKQLEDFVNDAINRAIPVEKVEMKFSEAKAKGGYGIHKAEEDEIVSVYKIGDVDFQICGGPHANNTSELVNFKIAKQEAVSAGVRRVKAIINFK